MQTPKERARIQWMLEDFDGFRSANLRKLCLGSLPKRAAKYACAKFDLEEEREYCGDDGVKVSGGMLAAVTAHIVRCAKDPIDYMFSLRDVPAKVIEPIKAYLRVKLAMGRLEAEISNAEMRDLARTMQFRGCRRPCTAAQIQVAFLARQHIWLQRDDGRLRIRPSRHIRLLDRKTRHVSTPKVEKSGAKIAR